MKNKDYNKKYKTVLLIAIILSVSLPVGIVMLVMGAVHAIIAVMIIGIVLTAAAFYGAPIVWAIAVPKVNRRRGLFNRINGKNSVDIAALSALTGRRDKSIIKDLQALVMAGYFSEYSFDKDYKFFYNHADNPVVQPGNPVSASAGASAESIKCDGCGAVFSLYNGAGQCPYCRRHYKKP